MDLLVVFCQKTQSAFNENMSDFEHVFECTFYKYNIVGFLCNM